MKYLSKMFEAVKDRVWEDYGRQNDDTRSVWRKSLGARWRGRVGIPRLIAENASYEALQLLRGISLSVHRNEPEQAALLREARQAVDDYCRAVGAENWKRFDGDD